MAIDMRKYDELLEKQYEKHFGKVAKVVGLTIESIGPDAKLNDMCYIIPKNGGEAVKAEVVGFRDDRVLLMPYDNVEGVGLGSYVENSGAPLKVYADDTLLGKTLDGLGIPIDGTQLEQKGAGYSVEATPPDPLKRKIIDEVLPLGVKAVDGLNTIGKGQRIGVFAGSGVGKSTLFNSLTKAGAESANYPFCTIDPNVGVVAVPDARLKLLGDLYHSKKVTPAVIEFVDIAGLVKGASKGEGLGNKFLSNIREVDAIVHVVRCFDDPNIIHVDGSINPRRDIETIDLELIFSDVELIERKLDRTKKTMKGDKSLASAVEFLEKLKEHLESGKPARSYDMTEDELEILKETPLLSLKPVIYAANLCEDDFRNNIESNEHYKEVCEIAKAEGSAVFPICAQIEAEISDMDDEDKEMFLADLGLETSGLNRIIKEGYSLLGLISYLTAGEPEVRAWTIKKGTKAPQAAGKIHTDFEKGFIRAEVVSFDDLMSCGSMTAAKEKGLVRLEGKDYVMQDGDIVLFRFNV